MWTAVWGAFTWFSALNVKSNSKSKHSRLCTTKMARIFCLVLLALLCMANSISSDDLQALKSRTATVYCGKNLSDVLSLVCRGKYNGPSQSFHNLHKRAVDAGKLNDPADIFYFPFISKENTKHFLSRFRRKRRQRRGVYNECCQKPCSYEVLKTYCAYD